MIFYDAVQEKPHTDENEMMCWHYDHSKGKAVQDSQTQTHRALTGFGRLYFERSFSAG